MRIVYIYTLLLLSVTGAWSQTRSAWVDAAEEAYDNKDYYSALSYYLETLAFDSSDIEVQYMVAESARKFLSYELAEDFYTQVISQDSDESYPKATYWLAQMQQMQGRYDMAKRNYELYLSTQEGEDEFITAKANKEIASIDWASVMIDNLDPSVEVSLLEGVYNTPFSEIAAIRHSNDVVFSSVKFLPEDRKKYGNRYIAKILAGQGIGENLEYRENLNSDNLHTAHTAFNLDNSKMFYTICNYANGSDIRCDLYSRSVDADGTLGEAFKLPAPINDDRWTNTQPNVGFDNAAGKEFLFFVSDRDEGEGGLDIWRVSIDGIDTYGTPENLGDINTAADDITPFYHSNSQVLYFSSDGYTSLGGYDIYRSVNDEGKFLKPENLGAPTNSSYNDAFYSLSADGEKALLSSNRVGSQYVDVLNKSCCYDIYKVDITDPVINLNALTFDAKSLDSLEGVTVKLICVESGEQLQEITNDIGNDHIFKLDRNKEYLIVSSKKNYATDSLYLNTNVVFKSEDIIRKIYLERTSIDLEVFTFDEISREPLPGVTVRLIDLTDGSIQEVELTNENGNDFLFNVVPGHSYRVEAIRDLYHPSSIEFVARDDDGSGVITKKLYLTRRNINVYLPLAVYFDNDRPDLKSNSLVTDARYLDLFDDYVILKEEFREKYSAGSRGAEKTLAENRVDEFFENEVKGGFDIFQGFLDYLIGQLQDGYSFDLSIRGFASPRADTRYNLALSQRRVVSVQNELRAYRDGVLIPFIDSGQLKITELSFGESLAPDNVSDVLYDRRNSVYSPEASKERRVEIVEIKKEEGL